MYFVFGVYCLVFFVFVFFHILGVRFSLLFDICCLFDVARCLFFVVCGSVLVVFFVRRAVVCCFLWCVLVVACRL